MLLHESPDFPDLLADVAREQAWTFILELTTQERRSAASRRVESERKPFKVSSYRRL